MFFHRQNLFTKISNFIFPIRCIKCKSSESYLCQSCLSTAKTSKAPPFSFIYPIFSFKDPIIREGIYLLKYKGVHSIAKTFAIQICDCITEILSEEKLFTKEKPLLVPIPMSKKRLKTRGYNHSTMIAKECRKILGKSISLETNLLKKKRETGRQALIKNKNERLLNIRDSFYVKNNKKVVGKTIFIIDDVTTSGATLKEAKRILRKAGAKEILAFVIAH